MKGSQILPLRLCSSKLHIPWGKDNLEEAAVPRKSQKTRMLFRPRATAAGMRELSHRLILKAP